MKNLSKDQNRGKIVYQTEYGEAWHGDSRKYLKTIPDSSVDLVFTSPPYALLKQKTYGNKPEDEYIRWFRPFVREIHRVLKDTGSFVLNIGNSWNAGSPTRSLYVFKLILELCEPPVYRRHPPIFKLAQEFFWFNPAKIPNPAQWVTVKRVRVKDATEYILWFSKTDNPNADNKRVLGPYSKSMEKLLATKKYNNGLRPSGWQISDDWARDHGGAIQGNVLPVDLIDSPHESPFGADIQMNIFSEANTSSSDQYRRACRDNGITAHPAMFPQALPEFFIRFLTKEGDLVVDPFAGSNTTGKVAEDLKRNWVAIDSEKSYLESSWFRFNSSQ